jgi:hypothetical protein
MDPHPSPGVAPAVIAPAVVAAERKKQKHDYNTGNFRKYFEKRCTEMADPRLEVLPRSAFAEKVVLDIGKVVSCLNTVRH